MPDRQADRLYPEHEGAVQGQHLYGERALSGALTTDQRSRGAPGAPRAASSPARRSARRRLELSQWQLSVPFFNVQPTGESAIWPHCAEVPLGASIMIVARSGGFIGSTE